MNVEIGTEAAQFLFWEYLNGIFVAVYSSMSYSQLACYHLTVGCFHYYCRTLLFNLYLGDLHLSRQFNRQRIKADFRMSLCYLNS